jgi:hypothetical protein
MDELGNNDDIILIFSLPYFKSRYCMYELLQIWKKGNVQQRVHPILIGELCLDDADFQLGVIKHWEYEAQSLQEKLNGYNSGSTIALRRRQVVFSEISHEVGNLLDFVSNMRFLSSDELRHQEFKPLLERISPILIISTKIKTNSNNNNRDIEKDRLSSLVKDLEIKHLRIKKNINQLSNEIVELKSNSSSEHKDIIEWLSKNKENHVEVIYDRIVMEHGELITNQKNTATPLEIKAFKLSVSQFIGRLEVCLLNKRVKIIDEPSIRKTFDKNLYKLALFFLSERIPSWIPENSRNKLNEYISYFMDRM